MPSEQRTLISLRTILIQRFSEEELRTLCQDLNVDYESLPAMGKAGKAREFVQYMRRRERVSDLQDYITELRPDTVDHMESAASSGAPASDQDVEVFLCYSSQDRSTANSIREALVVTGIEVWQDFDRIQAGAYFSIEIEQAIRRSDAIVVLVTQAARESSWVHSEVQFALDIQKPVIPLLLEADVTKMLEIYSIQHIKMYGDWEGGIASLAQCLRQLTPAEPHVMPMTQPTPLPDTPATISEKPASDAIDPFIYGTAVPSEMFVGRKETLDVIKSHVGHYSTLQSLSVVANRRIGKTSLLKYVAQNCQTLLSPEYDYAAVYIDAMDPRAHTCEGFMRILRRNTKRQLERELWCEKDDGRLAILNESLEELADCDGVRLILLLDEWESVMAYQEMDALLWALRSLGSRGKIGMITATAHSLTELKELGKITSPFPNIFKVTYLGNMPSSEWRELIQKGFAHSGVAPKESELALVGKLAGGHPYLTQLAGSLVWRARRKEWDKARIRTAFNQEARMIFSGIWQRLSPEQVRVIKAALGLVEADQMTDNVLMDLKSRGVLTEDEGPFCKPFADFVLQELESE